MTIAAVIIYGKRAYRDMQMCKAHMFVVLHNTYKTFECSNLGLVDFHKGIEYFRGKINHRKQKTVTALCLDPRAFICMYTKFIYYRLIEWLTRTKQ